MVCRTSSIPTWGCTCRGQVVSCHDVNTVCLPVFMYVHYTYVCAGCPVAELLLSHGYGPAGRLLLYVAVHGLHGGGVPGAWTSGGMNCSLSNGAGWGAGPCAHTYTCSWVVGVAWAGRVEFRRRLGVESSVWRAKRSGLSQCPGMGGPKAWCWVGLA